MNMEDRLRQAFEDEAEHLHAPSGAPETAMRRGRRRRASNLIGGAALVVALIGGTAVGVQVLGDTADPADTDPAAASRVAPTSEESTTTTSQSSSDVIDFRWERLELPTPAGADVWNIQVAALEDGFVAVGNGYGGEGASDVLTWTSPDGRSWTLHSDGPGFAGQVDQLFSTGEGFVAVVRSFDEEESVRLYTSPDGTSWVEGFADIGPVGPRQYFWFSSAAAGNGTTVLGGALQTEPPQPPIVFEEAGVVLQQSTFDGSFTVTELDDGTVITTIGSDVVYGEGSPTVYDETGAVIVVIPWEAIEGPGLDAERSGETLVYEAGDVRVELDYALYTYVATDLTSGKVLAEGPQDDLYQPPGVVITHPDTGAVVLDVTLEEFFEAEDRSYRTSGQDFEFRSEVLVLTTDDGVNWDRVELPAVATEEVNVSGVGFGPNGFMFSINRYGSTYGQDVWRSADGRDWELLDSNSEPREGQIVGHGDIYYSLGFGRQGRPLIASSPDGADWTTVFESEDGDVFFSTIAAGELGVVALGQGYENTFGPPLTISKEGRTMVLDYEQGRVTVTDDATGEELTVIEFDVWNEDPPPQFQIDEDTETLTLTDDAGMVLMVITNEEGEAAARQLEETYGPIDDVSIPYPAVAYSRDGIEWFTVTTEGLDVAWAQGMAVGKDSVVIVGDSLDSTYTEYGYESGGRLVLGEDGAEISAPAAPFPGSGAAPATYVWVGRPG